MLTAASFGASLRRLLHGTIRAILLTVAALVVAAPLLLGPAFGAALRALGAQDDHHCACGMQRGRCGCPECEELEAERQSGSALASSTACVRSSCDDDAYLPGAPALPRSIVPVTSILAEPSAERIVLSWSPEADPSAFSVRPPTPPPRALAA